MTTSVGLWDAFVEDGAELAGRIAAVTQDDSSLDFESVASDAQNVAVAALLLGCESIGRLALDCERALLQIVDQGDRPPVLFESLHDAGAKLGGAFDTLAAPNEADRLVNEEALAAASRRVVYVLRDEGPSTERSLASMAARAPAPASVEPPSTAPPLDLPLEPPAPPASPPGSAHPALSGQPLVGLATPVGAAHPLLGAAHPLLGANALVPPSDLTSAHPALLANVPTPLAPPALVGSPTTATRAPAVASEPWIWEVSVDDELLTVFFDELEERLSGLDQRLLALEREPAGELVNDIFRDLHTVKGNADLVGLVPAKNLAHAAEDLVAQLRSGEREATPPTIDILLDTLEELRSIGSSAQGDRVIDRTAEQRLVERLRAEAAAGIRPGPPLQPRAADTALVAPAAMSSLAEPPPVDAPHAGTRKSAVTQSASGATGQMLRVDFAKLDKLLNLVGELVLDKSSVSGNLERLAALSDTLEGGRRRISLASKTDNVGRARAALRGLEGDLGSVERELDELLDSMGRTSQRLDAVTGDLRDQVMKMRMVPVGRVFRRFGVKIRELGHRHNRRVRLELEGESTELDKMLVEQLETPLLHLVTNAVYHGIEPPDVRERAGKAREGCVTLRASHEGNQIVIVVEDDGAGIDPTVVRRVAVKRGIGSAQELAAMTDQEVRMLIFDPRFSRVSEVDQDAGRGVGTTVVWKSIVSDLKGTIELSSAAGAGTTFTLRLPLTLAIIQVLLVQVGSESYAIPLDLVRRTTTCSADEINVVCDREVVNLGDRQIPLIRLRDVLEVTSDTDDEHQSIVLVDTWGQTFGLVCDGLEGKQEVVIKSLGNLLEEVPGVMGATLIGDRCVLILEVAAIIERAIKGSRIGRRNASRDSTRAASAPRRILVVDDSAMARRAIVSALDDPSYRIVTAEDGVEGLRLASTEEFDLITTDAMMPNMDGYELTRLLRADKHPDTPIVMITTRSESADRVRGFDAGVDAYLTKPFERDELSSVVQSHLRRGPAQKA